MNPQHILTIHLLFATSTVKMSVVTSNMKEFDLEPLSGWKFKEDFPGRTRYQSPSGDYFKGKNRLMKFLLQNCSKDTITAMRSSFRSDGWSTDACLPRFWMWKKAGHKLMFLSPKEAILRSKEEAVTHIPTHEKYQSYVDLILSFKM